MGTNFIVLLMLFHLSVFQPKDTKALFEKRCAPCHGQEGNKRFMLVLAKKLQKSRLSDSAIFNTISNGRMMMPAYKNKLTQQEIRDMVAFVKSLRK